MLRGQLENREFSSQDLSSARQSARLGVLLVKALRGASSWGASGPRLLLPNRGYAGKGKIKKLAINLGILAVPIIQCLSQTNLQITTIQITDERAVHLEWRSETNHIYQVLCADALNGNPDGSTAWRLLHDNYPSHGSNTFWLDTGDYFKVPAIVHPKKMPMRFYRIVDRGTNQLSGDEPTISIISPANNFVATGEMIVSATAVSDLRQWTFAFL